MDATTVPSVVFTFHICLMVGEVIKGTGSCHQSWLNAWTGQRSKHMKNDSDCRIRSGVCPSY